MVKVKTISRSTTEFTRDRKSEALRVQKNPDATLHPLEKAKEYTRALNATKLERVFAKPFIGALSGHTDGVNCIARHPSSLTTLLTGACDGEIRIWHLPSKKTTLQIADAHIGFVRGIAVSNRKNEDNATFLSCGTDKTVKLWTLPKDEDDKRDSLQTPLKTFIGANPFSGISHQRNSNQFVTASHELDLWDYSRAEPIHTFNWGAESIYTVKFNPVQTEVVATTASDRNICLYDTRLQTPIRKVILKMATNALAWNPMEAFNFTIANEDQNLYTFDMRKLDAALKVHKDHVQAVLDVDYSPTGQEFVSGSYDRTIRLFSIHSARSREVYHTKRMQRIFCVKFTADAQYVLSGSDDTNVRIWKQSASAPSGLRHPRERQKLLYQQKLKQRYKDMPEIKRIARHRHLPNAIVVAKTQKRAHHESQKRKKDNLRKHSKPGAVPYQKEQEKNILGEEK